MTEIIDFTTQVNTPKNNKQRLDCSICNYHIDPTRESALATFFCNVRAFRDEPFKVWRCPNCQTIHCLDVVNLDHYYGQYPFAQAELRWTHDIVYGNLHRQLTKHGFSKNHSFLDYGCANGLFVKYLQQRGFSKCYGYDPYSPKEGFGDPTPLEQKPFDYILLQDVIEHIEDPQVLLSELDGLLSPEGYIFIGTPNATNIDLTRPNLSDYYNSVHVPYHLHIYTAETLEVLGRKQGWTPVEFFNRAFNDTPWLINTRAWNEYQRLCDGSLNAIFEPIKWKALTSYKFLFYTLFGYWFSLHTEMAIMFRKKSY